MSLILKKQKQISHIHPIPVDVTDEATRVTDVSGEAVSFIVASTNAADVGSAAGTVVYARLTNTGILDSAKIRLGSENDTSFVWGTGTALTTLVEFDWETFEANQYQTRAVKMAAIGVGFANGEYAVDHRTGLIIGKKTTTGTSDTASYSYRSSLGTVIGSVTVDSEFPAAAALTDNFANPTTTTVGAMLMAYDGATWDRMVGDAINGLKVDLGTNNDVTVTSGAITETNSGSILTSLQLIDDTVYTDGAGTPTKAVAVAGTDGTNPQILSVDTAGHLQINPLIGANAVVTIGAGAVDLGTQRIVTATDDPGVISLAIMDDWDNTASDGASVSGDVAHDGVDAGEPVKIGGKAFDPATPQTAVVANDRVNAMFDLNGRLVIYDGTLGYGEDSTEGLQAVAEKPTSSSTYMPSNDVSAAAEASSVTKASTGNLFGFTATNSSGSSRYFQIYNSTTVPADTAVPALSYFVAAGGTVSEVYPKGRNFSTGIAWAWSSTAATKTVGSTDGIAHVNYK